MTCDVRKKIAGLGIASAAAALSPAMALAHPGIGPAAGFAAGLAHPLLGLDHLVAMLGVGLWAAQRGGRALWAVPLAFVAVMALGGFLGAIGVGLPFVAPAIAASVLVLGVLIAAAVRMPLVASTLLAGGFALFHGHAHGTEMPATAAAIAYGAGFVLTTALLHGAGIGLGVLARKAGSERLLRVAGGATAVLGIALLIG